MNEIIDQYKKNFTHYDEFKKRLESLIKGILDKEDIKYHKIESRVKTIDSLEEKIKRKSEKYDSLDEITDLIGIRIITFFEDEVDKVAKIIGKQFKKDEENCVDKRQIEDDKFGYKSLHYVVKIGKNRENLAEYTKFKEIYFEIQIRSILQHARAEIEHNLGYKAEVSIPSHLKRTFSRVAALLEVSDLEFVKIKNDAKSYEKKVSLEIATNPENVGININSLSSYILNNKNVNTIDKGITKTSGMTLDKKETDEGYINELIKKLDFLGIKTIKKLDEDLINRKEIIIGFSKKFLEPEPGEKKIIGQMPKGVSIFYLGYILLAEENDPDRIQKYAKIMMGKDDSAKKLANRITTTFKTISGVYLS